MPASPAMGWERGAGTGAGGGGTSPAAGWPAPQSSNSRRRWPAPLLLPPLACRLRQLRRYAWPLSRDFWYNGAAGCVQQRRARSPCLTTAGSWPKSVTASDRQLPGGRQSLQARPPGCGGCTAGTQVPEAPRALDLTTWVSLFPIDLPHCGRKERAGTTPRCAVAAAMGGHEQAPPAAVRPRSGHKAGLVLIRFLTMRLRPVRGHLSAREQA